MRLRRWFRSRVDLLDELEVLTDEVVTLHAVVERARAALHRTVAVNRDLIRTAERMKHSSERWKARARLLHAVAPPGLGDAVMQHMTDVERLTGVDRG